MSTIKEDFALYLDGNHLMAPNPVPLGTQRGSDNGPMFTSEYVIILNRNGALTAQDRLDYTNVIATCVSDSQLHRAPGDTTIDAPDDYYGVYSAHVELGLKPIFKLPFNLWRQPQLVYAALCAADLNPFLMVLTAPLAVYSALVIATSCIWTNVSNTDARRLSWHLIQATKNNSILCKSASYIWYWRLKKYYGNDEMKAVAGIYYLPHGLNANPYSKWWVN